MIFTVKRIIPRLIHSKIVILILIVALFLLTIAARDIIGKTMIN
jgi:hypothetical protein